MKYYLAFISINDTFRSKIKGFGGLSNPFDWEYDKELDMWMALYAWTTNKKIMKIFKSQRNPDLFIYKKIDSFDDEERFIHEESNLKLNKYEYPSGRNGKLDIIVSTAFENTLCSDEGFVVECLLKDQYIPDPLIFKKDIFNIFDRVGYSYMFYNYSCSILPFTDDGDYDDDSSTVVTKSEYCHELEGRQDVFWNNYSYMDYDKMRYINEVGGYGYAIKINEFNVFICLFGLLFK